MSNATQPPLPPSQALKRNMRLWRGLARAWPALLRLRQRAAERAYAPDGAGYEAMQSHFEQHQRDELEEREAGAKRQHVSSPST